MIFKVVNILEYSRIFSLPMTILSWLVVFTYSFINSGNVLYGVISLIGLCFAHLGTNLIDDYFDYKSLIKMVNFDKQEYLKQSQKTKCRYLINGTLKESQLLLISSFYFGIAMLCGYFLFLKCGIGVLYFALVGAIIAISYSFLSRICLSEFAVAVAFGPALFGGVYYVMTGTYSFDVFVLSIPTTIMTVILLYIHTVMDYQFDLNENKKTIANRFTTQKDALKLLKIFLLLSYISILLPCIFDIIDWQIFLVFLTIPLAIDLYKSLSKFIENPADIIERKWFHYPMYEISKIKNLDEVSFVVRLLQARNLMIYFSFFIVIAMIINLMI